MINTAYWWSAGAGPENNYCVGLLLPEPGSMPAVLQPLSDAIRVIMLLNIPVDGLRGMLDDFFGIIYRKEGETDEELLRRERRVPTRLMRNWSRRE